MTIHEEIERDLYVAIRRSWRALAPDWQAREADTVLALATAAILRRQPDLADAEVLAELRRLGIVTAEGVRVPPLPGPVPVAGSGLVQ
ncbi:MAG: hypothetical protein MUC71_03255 [Steroidobacteraceae bacterium]|jgi:hypothetical protein|nr:hypothetical protein [Steroidobacteraceae bacterium]